MLRDMEAPCISRLIAVDQGGNSRIDRGCQSRCYRTSQVGTAVNGVSGHTRWFDQVSFVPSDVIDRQSPRKDVHRLRYALALQPVGRDPNTGDDNAMLALQGLSGFLISDMASCSPSIPPRN